MTLGLSGAAEFTKFDASLTNSDYYVGKDREMAKGQNVTVTANNALDPDAGLINRGSRVNHDNVHNNPYAPRNKAEEWASLPEYPQGFPQGYSQALSDKASRKVSGRPPSPMRRHSSPRPRCCISLAFGSRYVARRARGCLLHAKHFLRRQEEIACHVHVRSLLASSLLVYSSAITHLSPLPCTSVLAQSTSPVATDKARTNFVNTLGGLGNSSPPQGQDGNPFSSRLFRSGVAGRPGSPQRFYSDGDSFFSSRP